MTLRNAIMTHKFPFVFEVKETGETYQAVGKSKNTFNFIIVKPLDSEELYEVSDNIEIWRIF